MADFPDIFIIFFAIAPYLIPVMLVVIVWLIISHLLLRKRLNRFLKPGVQSSDIESVLLEFLEKVKVVDDKYTVVLTNIENINSRLSTSIRKVGMVRYNPFQEMGGDLCFALALLDESNNGVVLNAIHDRNSSYTYAKPLINQTSAYNLSDEERQAIQKALTFEPGAEPISVSGGRKAVLKR